MLPVPGQESDLDWPEAKFSGGLSSLVQETGRDDMDV